jgi:hypothetical protein
LFHVENNHIWSLALILEGLFCESSQLWLLEYKRMWLPTLLIQQIALKEVLGYAVRTGIRTMRNLFFHSVCLMSSS